MALSPRILTPYYAGAFPAKPVLQELKRLGYATTIVNSCYIHEARNRLVSGMCQEVRQQHPDGVTVFIDADMVLTVADVLALLKGAEQCDIVCAPYRTQKDDGIDCCGRSGGSGLVEVDYAGFGLIAINNRVFNALDFPYFEHPTVKIDNCADVKGEDIYFCEKARKAGFKIYADYDIKIDHQLRKGVKKMEQQVPNDLDKLQLEAQRMWEAANKTYQAVIEMLKKTVKEKEVLQKKLDSCQPGPDAEQPTAEPAE